MDCDNIHDWPSFHQAFVQVFGFPAIYGNNMDAWIDCLTSLDVPEDGMSRFTASRAVLTLELENVKDFAQRCPEEYKAMIECAAFVNWRRIATGGSSILALSFRT